MSTEPPHPESSTSPRPLRVLFFLEPREELGDPLFRYPTLRNSFLPQMRRLRADGHQAHLLLGERVAREAASDGLRGELGEHSVLSLPTTTPEMTAALWFEEPPPDAPLAAMRESVRAALPPEFRPDVIIVWESPCPYLAAEFPDATLLQQWPGFFSRPPFVELVAFDTGLVHRSAAASVLAAHRDVIEANDQFEGLSRLRTRDLPLLEDAWPMPGLLSRWRRRFDALVLVPLQVDDYFAVTEVLPEGQRQIDWLHSLLEAAPPGVGLVVTQYVSKRQASGVLDDETVAALRQRHSAFLYDRRFDDVPWCSQLMAPQLDGVIALSSSLGWQAAYWQKPLFCAGPSHISPFATAPDLGELFEQALASEIIDRDAMIAQVMLRMHVPMRALANEPGMLADWLGALREADRDGCLIDGRWPPQRETGPYFDALVSGRRETELSLAFKRRGLRFPRPHRSFWDELADALDLVEVVSFDVFDTLIERPLAAPTDVFDIMATRIRVRLNAPALDFRGERRAAEATAVERARARMQGEATLEEIYDVLGETLTLDDTTTRELMELELETEAQLLRPRPSGLRALAMARSSGRRIILVSDMYLPRVWIEERLHALGVEGWECLFVSSETRLKKQDGSLFPMVEERLGLPASAFLHVGDNRIGDLQRPRERGWAALHLRRAGPEMQRSPMTPLLPAEAPTEYRLMAGVVWAGVACGRHDDPDRSPESEAGLFGGDPNRLGQSALGPLLLGLARWLYRRAREEGYETLYFLARDGEIMKRAYDIFVEDLEDAPASRFLLCSRRAVNVANLRTRDDIFALLEVDYATTSLRSLLEHRYGLDASSLSVSVEEHGLALHRPVGMVDRSRLRPLLDALSPEILQGAAREREAYLEYCEASGLQSLAGAAVVDIGYAGTMQESLHRILGASAPLGGLYLLTFDSARERAESGRLPMDGYLGHLVDHRSLEHPLPRRVPIYETFFSNDATSFICFQRENGELVPRFAQSSALDEQRAALTVAIQEGALSFMARTSAAARALSESSWPEPLDMLRPLASFIAQPTAVDASLFLGIAFEDVYGGREPRRLIPTRDRLETDFGLWSEGQEALLAEVSEGAGAQIISSAREFVSRAFLVPLVDGLAPRFLNPRKLWKLRHEPAAFFADARQPWIQRIGRLYVDAATVRIRGG